jgi:hypothetical protein
MSLGCAEYFPDKWVVIKVTSPEVKLYRVFACWFGGYASSDSWKINSGITKVVPIENGYSFEGYSGSSYKCSKETYGTNFYGGSVLNSFIENGAKEGITIEVLPEDTNFLELV